MMRLILLAGLVLAAVAPARAETFHVCNQFITAIPTTLSSQGVYCLTQDVSTAISSGAAITIAAPNVTLDCNGYKIGGLAAGPTTEAVGIKIDAGSSANRANATIRNCAIRGFETGLHAYLAPGLLVEDNRFEQSRRAGLTLVYAGGCTVRRNLVSDTGQISDAPVSVKGIEVSGAGCDISGNTIRNTFSSSSVRGISGINCDSCSVRDNLVIGLVGTYEEGIGFTGGLYADQARVLGNTVTRLATTPATSADYGIFAPGLCKDNTVNGPFVQMVNCETTLDNVVNP